MTLPATTQVEFSDALSERYLAYALSTIMSRSLPDVRDGLKPVHRRLLYAMLQLKLDPESGYKKCARVVGDVIGKYHPHGEVAVYDTLVRLAQSFSLRYPLIDGQGNFGSLDGDNAAAMRYTESRLTEIAMELARDLDKNTVDFRPTYDNSEEEPVLFPAGFPNILANGSEGIAVGMATCVPPHNLHELCDAMLHMLKDEDASIDKLLDFVHGPDFPTGGTIVSSKSAIAQIYHTGKGSIKLRAKWKVEPLSHGVYQIVVYEIPYQVQKSKLLEQLAALYKEKKIPLVDGLRDESAEDIRVIIEPKNRLCDASVIMESLFKQSDLETRIHANMNVLSSRSIPVVMNLKSILEEFLEHRQNIIIRRSKFRLDKIDHRLEVLGGYIVAYLNLDEVIKIVREEDEPKPVLIQRFNLTELQAESILNMRLRSLRKLEEMEIRSEQDALAEERKALVLAIDSRDERKNIIKGELKELQKKFGYKTEIGARKTDFAEVDENISNVINIEALIEREPITVLLSKKGWIRSLKGHITEFGGIKYKEGDEEWLNLKCYTTDKILIPTDFGKFYTILGDNIYKGKGDGEQVKLVVSMESDECVLSLHILKPELKFLLASRRGKGFIVDAAEVVAQTKMGKQVLNIGSGDKAGFVIEINGDMVASIGNNRKLLVFYLSEIPEMKRGSGVAFQKFKDGLLSDLQVFKKDEGFVWKAASGKQKVEINLLPWIGKRAGVGRIPPAGFSKDNRF